MFRIFLLLIIVVPAFEIGILIYSGKVLGIPPTIALILITGVIGAWLAKREGLETIRLAQVQIQNGQLPGEAIMDGICILVGGTLLLTPGFITDTVGFLLLIPATRAIVKKWLRKFIQNKINNGQFIYTIRK
jgi:UPF0716 protein FxsA